MASVSLVYITIHASILSFDKYFLDFSCRLAVVLGSEDTSENKSVVTSAFTELTLWRARMNRIKQGERMITYFKTCTEGKNGVISGV